MSKRIAKPALAKKGKEDSTATIEKETRTYWLSFADSKDGSNLGVIITTVSKEDADVTLMKFPTMHDKVEGPWVVAAIMKAHRLKICPGGECAAYKLDTEDFGKWQKFYSLDKLLSRTDIDNAALQAKYSVEHPSLTGGVGIEDNDGI